MTTMNLAAGRPARPPLTTMNLAAGRLSWPMALWLATRGGRTDLVRIGLTAAGTALGTIAVLAAATVMAIGPEDGPYRSDLLSQSGLRPGVVISLLLLCVPILAVVGQCARIGAPARDRRLAAIRLAGGAPADATRIACGEAAVAAGAGSLVGLLGYLAGRALLDAPAPGVHVRITETVTAGGVQIVSEEVEGLVRPLPTDVLPPGWVLVLVVLAVPVATVAFTRLALRRVTISPFGVVRRRSVRPPRVLPAVLFLAGATGLIAFSAVVRALGLDEQSGSAALALFFGLFLVTSAGLVLGNAALAVVVGEFVGRRTGSPALLIAARRLVMDPYGASRAYGALLVTVLLGAGAQGVRVAILASTDPRDTFYRNALDLVDLVIVVAVVVAALGLLVVAAEEIVSRRRSLAALTAAGTPVGVLRRAVLAQGVLPLLLTAPLAAAAGVLAARGLFGTRVEVEGSGTVPPDGTYVTEFIPIPLPWAELAVLVLGTLVVALAFTAVSLTFLRSSTDPGELRAAA